MKSDGSRLRRVEDQLQRELAQLVQREMKDPRVGMITLTAVRVTKEFETATVYFTVMESEEQAVKETLGVLNRAAGFLRREIGRRLSLRHVPEIRFKYDESVANGVRINALISSARALDEQHKEQHKPAAPTDATTPGESPESHDSRDSHDSQAS